MVPPETDPRKIVVMELAEDERLYSALLTSLVEVRSSSRQIEHIRVSTITATLIDVCFHVEL